MALGIVQAWFPAAILAQMPIPADYLDPDIFQQFFTTGRSSPRFSMQKPGTGARPSHEQPQNAGCDCHFARCWLDVLPWATLAEKQGGLECSTT
jgi:hypothetical protein